MTKPLINIVSNINISEINGGISGLNKQIFNQLVIQFEINYINVPKCKRGCGSLIYSIFRWLKFKTIFDAFNEGYLNEVSLIIAQKVDFNAPILFIGITPYINFSGTNYFVFNDCDFNTYLDFYTDRNKFSNKHLIYLVEKEKKFLERSRGIFYTSNWAKDRTVRYLGIEKNKIHITKQGGNIPIAGDKTNIELSSPIKFVFISTDFDKKGGCLAITIIEELNKKINAELIIFGAPPTKKIESSFVKYCGWINKENKNDVQNLVLAFSESFGLILPTKSDILPLSIIEAGYYGCPSFTTDVGAISNLINNGKNGFIYNLDGFEENVIFDILALHHDNERYVEIRNFTKQYYRICYDWTSFGKVISENILNEINCNTPL
jgi:glycosyltransferase involved in cell wall biosynthesis